MNVARHSKRCLAALMASMITVVDVHAAVTDIYSQPLATTSSVVAKPNVMFILDNSGSMANNYMPDDMSSLGRYGFWSSQCNGVAYDPSTSVSYAPPIKADGTSYPDVDFNNAPSDGYAATQLTNTSSSTLTVGTGSKTWNLPSASSNDYEEGEHVIITSPSSASVKVSGIVTSWNASNSKNLVVNIVNTAGSGSYSSWTITSAGDLNSSTYYNYTGGQTGMNWTYSASGSVQTGTTFYGECQSDIGSTPGSGVFTAATVTNASAEKQRYANWYSYYRTRRLMTRTATGRAFAALTSDFRVGFTTISDTGVTNGTNKFVDIGDYTAAKKTAFYSSLYTATGSSNTPLRGALAKVGRYFANKAPGQASDPMQYSCQRNYAILSTDGYWNTGSETTSYGPNQLTTNTAVGQQDAGEAKPMWDGTHTIVTAVTPYTTVTRKQTISTRTDTANMRRYAYPVPGSKGGGSCSNSEYRIRVQQQNSTTSTPVSITSVDDVTSVYNNTVVTTDGVITSNTNSTPTNTGTVNVSSITTNGTPSSGAWSNSGGSTDYCRTAAQLTAAGMLVNTTYYSSTNAPTYTAISANGVQTSSSTGSVTAGTPTILSTNGPTAGTTTSTPSTSGGASSTLADVAEYYYATDLRTAALNNCTGSVGPDGSTHDVCSNSTMLPMPPLDVATHQHMTTYTIGLGVNGTLAYDPNYLSQTSGAYVQLTSGAITWPVPASTSNGGDARNIDDLWHAGVNGRGKYFATSNPNTLSNALQGALTDVTKAVGSAAGAATNSLEPVAGDNNQAYIATYTTVEWTGDIKAYPLDAMTGVIDTTTAIWSAKTQLEAISAGSRTIKYMHPTTKALRSFTYSNLNTDGYGANFLDFCSKTPTPLQCGTLNATQAGTGATGAGNGDNLVNFLRGDSTYEAQTNLANPLYRERTAKLGDIINASPAYVKKSPLQYTDSGHASYVTSTATRKGVLYGAANDGMLHAFDATSGSEMWAFVPSFVMPNMFQLADNNYRDNHKFFVDGSPVVGDIYTGSAWKTILVGGLNSGGRGYYALDITDPDNPVGLWEFTNANMGLTYGNPVITKRADGTWVVMVASGLNNTSGDNQGHLYQINALTGSLLSSLSTSAGTSGTPSGLAKINGWVDDPSNNTAKRFYGGDMLGNLWRFDFDDLVPPSGAEATQLAQFQIGGTPQPITTKPQLTEVTASTGVKYPVIVVGTGRYLGTSDVSDTAQQSIYAIKDPMTATGWGDVRTRTDLVSQSVTVSGTNGTGTSNAVDWTTKIGWKLDLPQSKERVVTDFLLQFNVLSFASAIPGASECNPAGGSSWLYEINVGTGTAANGSTVSEFLGGFLVVGMTYLKTADGKQKIEIVGSDASVHTKQPPPPISDASKVRRSAWRELIN